MSIHLYGGACGAVELLCVILRGVSNNNRNNIQSTPINSNGVDKTKTKHNDLHEGKIYYMPVVLDCM